PAFFTWVVMLILLPLRPPWFVFSLLVAALTGYGTLMMVLLLLRGGVALVRRLTPRHRADQIAGEDLPEWQWSMPLCHQRDPAHADDLLRLVSHRLRRLITSVVLDAGVELGGKVGSVEVNETLVCLTNGITTAEMRTAIRAVAARTQPDDEE